MRAREGFFTLCCWRDYQYMKGYFRVLCILVVVEVVELILRFFDVHGICYSPEAVAARNSSNHTGMTAEECELFSNMYVLNRDIKHDLGFA